MAMRSMLRLAAERAAAGEDAVTQATRSTFRDATVSTPPISESELRGNIGRLALGLAQMTRVNDPNRYVKPNKHGRYVSEDPKIGLARNRSEIGGPLMDAGAYFGNFFGSNYGEHDRQKYRIARIFKVRPSHMHNTTSAMESAGISRWAVMLNDLGFWKETLDGHNYTADAHHKMIRAGFLSARDAMVWCHDMGFGFEVEMPRVRYHVRKSFADNFKWRGPDN